MTNRMVPPVFSSFLLKVASRCNLACDYCYVYRHGDDSWRSKPKLMSTDVASLVAERVAEYFRNVPVPVSTFVFHGGEPLLWGAERIAETVELLRTSIGNYSRPNFSVQTNAVLLDSEAIRILADAGVKVSVSLDGPANLHDSHRPDHRGSPSHGETLRNLEHLRDVAPQIFSGVLAVVDFESSPSELLRYFSDLGITELDLLLPDRHHDTVRTSRIGDEVEAEWVRACIRTWYNSYPHLKIRWFDAMLEGICGLPSPTDAMGFGDVSLCTIDTDGTYGDHDVFKIVGAPYAQTGLSVATATIEQLGRAPSIARHRELLRLGGLSQSCRECHLVSSCGGGAVMHRYSRSAGFDNRSAHCISLKAALEEVVSILRDDATPPLSDSSASKSVLETDASLVQACIGWAKQRSSASPVGSARSHGASALLSIVREQTAVGPPMPPIGYLDGVAIHRADPVFDVAFGEEIVQYSVDRQPALPDAMARVRQAMDLISEYSPELHGSITSLVSDIVFAYATTEATGIFSFSDDAAPDVIFVDPFLPGSSKTLRVEDLADSIIHEFFHHVLFHHDSEWTLLLDYEHPHLPAPWCRWELRPAGGFLHGTYVFAHLSKFWAWLDESLGGASPSAASNATRFTNWAHHGVQALRSGALLTASGLEFVERLEIGLKRS